MKYLALLLLLVSCRDTMSVQDAKDSGYFVKYYDKVLTDINFAGSTFDRNGTIHFVFGTDTLKITHDKYSLYVVK